MTDKRHITFVLDSHDADQLAVTFQTPKNNTIMVLPINQSSKKPRNSSDVFNPLPVGFKSGFDDAGFSKGARFWHDGASFRSEASN